MSFPESDHAFQYRQYKSGQTETNPGSGNVTEAGDGGLRVRTCCRSLSFSCCSAWYCWLKLLVAACTIADVVDRCPRTCRSSSSSDDETEIESELDSHEISDVEDEYEEKNYVKMY